jgi:hypothetical protein
LTGPPESDASASVLARYRAMASSASSWVISPDWTRSWMPSSADIFWSWRTARSILKINGSSCLN